MPSANDRISEYVLDAKIGGGAFGEVWRAHHHVWTDRLVAIKIPTDTQYLRSLQREGTAIHGLQHPNIVHAMGFDPYANPPYLTMEYVPGTSLRPLIQGRRLSIPDSVAILQQVLRGLGYAHAQGVIHRDVKPENVLVHERAFRDGYGVEGVVKVTDFGLGKVAAAASAGSILYSQSMSGPGAAEIAGTLDYMAPELRGGGEPDPRADLYACGVMLYELLTGERPAGTDLPSELNPKVPKQLDEVFRRSYARLEKRYANAQQFYEALSPVAAPTASAPRPPAVPPLPPRATMPPPPVVTAGGRKSCPRCSQAVGPYDQFCTSCGTQLVAVVPRCPRCGAFPDHADRHCIFCGETLRPGAAVTA